MKIVDSIWFTPLDGTVGIVLGEDEVTGEHKAYIGIAKGANQEEDEDDIAKLGTKFNYQIAARVAKWLKGGKKK